MPELDYAFLCDYVRSEGGVAHIIGAGIDTLTVPQVPGVANLGLLARVTYNRTESGRPHRIEVILAETDGENVAHLAATPTFEWTKGLPTGWKQGMFLALNFGVPLPKYGLYTVDILINDDHKKALNLRVIEPPAQATPADAGEAPPEA
jgi:hypothetical protein